MVVSPHTGTYGYVLSQNEDTRELTVHLTTNDVVTIPGPIYSRGTITFDFVPFPCYGHVHEVKTYTPIYIYSFPQEVICRLLCIDMDALRI